MTEPSVEITDRISTNKSRQTRSVYSGTCNGRPAIIKAFAHPTRGWLHWWQCNLHARVIRRRGIPAPQLLYSGWLEQLGARVIIYERLEEARDFRWLRDQNDRAAVVAGLARLLQLFALMHARGVTQGDTTLGNFLEQDGVIHVIDEDRINLRPWPAGHHASLRNIASLLSQWRLHLSEDEIFSLYAEYCACRGRKVIPADQQRLVSMIERFRQRRHARKNKGS